MGGVLSASIGGKAGQGTGCVVVGRVGGRWCSVCGECLAVKCEDGSEDRVEWAHEGVVVFKWWLGVGGGA